MLKIFRKIWLIILIIFFIILVRFGLFNFLQRALGQGLEGLNRGYFSISNFFASFRSRKELMAENQRLYEEVLKLKTEVSQLRAKELENETLRESLNFTKSVAYQVRQVNIIGKRIEASAVFYIIDQGENAGLKKGLAVIQTNGYLVGKLFKTEKNFSLFLPLMNNYFSAAVDIISPEVSQDKKGVLKSLTTGLAQGKYGILTEIDLIPSDREIKIGDFIITSGLEELVPRGLLLGQLEKIETGADKLFQRAILNSPIKIDELRIVGVVVF